MAVYLRLRTRQSLVLRTLGSHGSTLTTSHCKQKLLCPGLRTALVYASCASITAVGTSCLESGIAVCKVQAGKRIFVICTPDRKLAEM